MKKSLLKVLLLSPMMMGALTGCNNAKITIGILQPVEHDALALAREGFIEAVKSAKLGVAFDYQNANGVEADQNLLAKTLVSSCDLTLGIGTGASLSLSAASQNAGLEKPILFTAVTDPVSAGLVDSLESPGSYITGTSDMNPVVDQIDLIKQCLPNATKIGILYTQSEVNSQVQAEQARAEAIKQGLQVEVATCTDSSDLPAVVNDLCSSRGIQALYIPTDNNVAAHMDPVKAAIETNHILTVCGEESMMALGGHITLSVNYKELGRRTGEMAVKILKDKVAPKDIPVGVMTAAECTMVMCSENMTSAGVSIPDDIKNRCTDVPAA